MSSFLVVDNNNKNQDAIKEHFATIGTNVTNVILKNNDEETPSVAFALVQFANRIDAEKVRAHFAF